MYSKEYVLEKIKRNGLELKNFIKFQDDKDVVFEAVKNNGWALEYASDRLKNDEDIVLEALLKNNNKNLMRFVSPELKKDKDFIFFLVFNDIRFFTFCDKSLKNNKDFVLKVIKKGKNIKNIEKYSINHYISKTLKDDKDIILAGVSKEIFNYSCLSYKIRSDNKFMKKLIEINYNILDFASDEVKNDKNFIKKVVGRNFGALEYASDRLKNDKDVVLEACKNGGGALIIASQNLQKDKDIILEAVKNCGEILKFLPKEILFNPRIVDKKILETALPTYPEAKRLLDKIEQSLFEGLEDRGIGYLGVLELLFNEIESYGEEVEKKCCFDDNTSWIDTKKIYIEYYTKNMMESNYLWDCIAEISNSLSEALKEII